MKMRWIFLMAALLASGCVKKKTTKENLKPIQRDTGLLPEEDQDDLPEAFIAPPES